MEVVFWLQIVFTFLLGYMLGRNSEALDDIQDRIAKVANLAPTIKSKTKVGIVKNPSAQDLNKRQDKIRMEGEQAMRELIETQILTKEQIRLEA